MYLHTHIHIAAAPKASLERERERENGGSERRATSKGIGEEAFFRTYITCICIYIACMYIWYARYVRRYLGRVARNWRTQGAAGAPGGAVRARPVMFCHRGAVGEKKDRERVS